MLCYQCGCLCDFNESRICEICRKLINDNNEKVRAYSLLRLSEEFCPVWLREKIENFWETTKVSSRFPAE